MTSYKDLTVWKQSVDLTMMVYRATAEFPYEERFGLSSQLRRSAVSIASNIAEGRGRRTRGDFLHFLSQARGSVLELETQLLLAHRLGYLSTVQYACFEEASASCARLLNGLIRSLRTNN